MIKKIGSFLLLISLCLPFLSSCAMEREVTYFQYFDTVISISSTKEKNGDFKAHTAAAEEMIAKYHKLFDVYHEYTGVNNLCTVNRAAGKEAVKIESELFDFLIAAKELYEITDGHLNVMMGAVTSLWNTARANAESGSAALPSKQALAEAKKHISIENLVLDRENRTAYIADPAASLDVGAFGKGYAAERVSELLYARDVQNGYVLDFGGNLRVIGAPHNKEHFTAGIQNPNAPESVEYVLRLSMKNNSLVTSGSYFRYFEIDGKRYHHLIDPETAHPADAFVSVSILGPDSGICDALSTALFVMELSEGEALIEALEGYEAVWVSASGEMHTSKGIKEFVVK